MFGTYKENDVKILLRDISGLVKPLSTAEREKLIQSGRHYSEMLPIEYEPSEKYLQAYFDALNRYSKITAAAVSFEYRLMASKYVCKYFSDGSYSIGNISE